MTSCVLSADDFYSWFVNSTLLSVSLLCGKNMKEKKKKKQDKQRQCNCVRCVGLLFFFYYTFERFLSRLHLPCEVAILISCSQTCFFFFFCSQHIRGRSTLLATGHAPSWPLSTHIDGSLQAAWMSGSRRGVTCCERGPLSLKALPQTNKDNSRSTSYPQPEPNIAYGLPSFPLVGAAVAVGVWEAPELTHASVYFSRGKDSKD